MTNTANIIDLNLATSGENSDVRDPLIAATAFDDAVRDLRVQQTNYANARGKAALAGMVVDGFIATETIIASTDIEEQALLLSRHGVNMASGSTSVFSPWIAAMWGEHDTSKKITDLDEVEHDKWIPNASMAVYFHTMETFHEKGWSAATPRDEMIAWPTTRRTSC